MKLDERNLPLSTDSAEAAALFDRAVEHYLKFHADTMALVGRALAADPDFVMGHCLKGYLLLIAANPAYRQQIAATLAAAEANAAPPRSARSTMSPPSPPGARELDRSFAIWRQILDAEPTDLLAFAHLRHHLVPPRPDGRRSWSRPTASRRAGRPTCPATTAANASGPSRMRRPATRRPPNARWTRRSSVTRPTTSRITSRRMCMEMDCRPREGSDWLASQVRNWSPATT